MNMLPFAFVCIYLHKYLSNSYLRTALFIVGKMSTVVSAFADLSPCGIWELNPCCQDTKEIVDNSVYSPLHIEIRPATKQINL